jgi:hypothetical protein
MWIGRWKRIADLDPFVLGILFRRHGLKLFGFVRIVHRVPQEPYGLALHGADLIACSRFPWHRPYCGAGGAKAKLNVCTHALLWSPESRAAFVTLPAQVGFDVAAQDAGPVLSGQLVHVREVWENLAVNSLPQPALIVPKRGLLPPRGAHSRQPHLGCPHGHMIRPAPSSLARTQRRAKHSHDAIFRRLIRRAETFPDLDCAARRRAKPGFLLVLCSRLAVGFAHRLCAADILA